MRTTFVAAALAALIAATVAAQSLTEQLQKGIYAEDTLGDADAAIAIYRRIVATAPAQQDIALQARRRLATALERKGALQAPPVQIKTGLQTSPVQQISHFVGGEPEPLGTVENGRYRHTWTGVEFTVPEGWLVEGTYMSSDSGQQTQLRDPKSRVTMSVWMIKEKRAAADVVAELAGAPGEKVNQRQNLGYNIPGMVSGTYDIPKETIQLMSIGGRQAVMAVGEYYNSRDPVALVRWNELSKRGLVPPSHPGPEQDPISMNEYMAWIYTENTRAFFFGRVRTVDLLEFRPYFDQIIQSAIVP
jgi:hypothetical protein